MIKIVSKSYLERKFSYRTDEYIPQSSECFCFSIFDLLKNELNFSFDYFLKILTAIDYLTSVLNLLIIAIEEKQRLDEELNENSENFWFNTNCFKVDGISATLTIKEKDGYDIIKHGKIVYREAKKLLEFSNTPEWFRNLMEEKQKLILDFSNENAHQTSFEYENVFMDEISIYKFFINDILSKTIIIETEMGKIKKIESLQNEIAKYCTAQKYFTNSGTCYFGISDDLYNYFIGNTKGMLPSCKERIDVVRHFDKENFELIKKQLNEVKVSIKSLLQPSHVISYDNTKNNGEKITDAKLNNKLINLIHKTHDNLPENLFIKMLEAKLLTEKGNKFEITKNYGQRFITYLCSNAKYSQIKTYKELFSNKKIQRNIYDMDKSKDSSYKNNLSKFATEIENLCQE